MKTVLMNLQNFLFAEAVERSLREDGDFRILNIADPGDVVHQCKLTCPEVVFMEVTRYPPWEVAERMKIRSDLSRALPECKVVWMVNENLDASVAEQVKQAKLDGKIDGFVFSSVTTSYLSAFLQTV